MTVELRLPGGGTAVVIAADCDRTTLLSTKAFPPGSSLVAELPSGEGSIRVKVRECRREVAPAGPVFRVEGRFVNLSRKARAKLLGPEEV